MRGSRGEGKQAAYVSGTLVRLNPVRQADIFGEPTFFRAFVHFQKEPLRSNCLFASAAAAWRWAEEIIAQRAANVLREAA